MAIMQVVAARAAGVSRLVFHTVDGRGADDFETALALPGLAAFTDSERIDPEAFLEYCSGQRFQWGISNGT
jgi:hypothetical protein